MCLDIDPDSVIHKHLVKKITALNEDYYTDTGGYDTGFETLINPIINRETDRIKFNESVIKNRQSLEDCYAECKSKHNLTMLPSFHISLGPVPTPDKSCEIQKNIIKIEPQIIPIHRIIRTDLNQLVGDITLSNIYISENENKKSAWIRLTDFFTTFFDILDRPKNDKNPIIKQLLYSKWKGKYVDELHISLANLTGNPHDSIARPEDCIIDTITN